MTSTISTSAAGKPRPLTRVVLFSIASGLLYYGYYKWIIQDELRAYGQRVWSGAVCIIPFVLGIAVPLLLAQFDPDVPGWFGFFAFSGVGGFMLCSFGCTRKLIGCMWKKGERHRW